MIFSVEAWTIPNDNDEEPCNEEMVACQDFANVPEAMIWAWDRLEEGFFVRMWRRER